MKWKVPKKSGMFLHVTSPFGGSGGFYSVRQALAELQSDDVFQPILAVGFVLCSEDRKDLTIQHLLLCWLICLK